MDPFKKHIDKITRLYQEGLKDLPLPPPEETPSSQVHQSRTKSENDHAKRKVLVFAPHPDDEAIMGGLALRLRSEAAFEIVNIAVTLGSDKSRQASRMAELEACCRVLGFAHEIAGQCGLEYIQPDIRRKDPGHWFKAVDHIALKIKEHQPNIIFYPHSSDNHPTHIAVHFLIVNALMRLNLKTPLICCETEYWSPTDEPNLLVELSENEVAAIMKALACHTGEMRRNPYHMRYPAWLMDNVRRAGEIIRGPGAAPPRMIYGQPYRLRVWQDNSHKNPFRKNEPGAQIMKSENSWEALRHILEIHDQ